MLPKAKNDMFAIELPKDFFSETIIKKYDFYINQLSNPYENIRDFMNGSIQGFSLPSISLGTVTQSFKGDTNIKYRDGIEFDKQVDKEITITFKLYEGFVNYWIMFEQLKEYFALSKKREYFNPIFLHLLDINGMSLIDITFDKVLCTNISELTLNYSSNIPDMQTFDVTFNYNYFNISNQLFED